MIEAAVKAGKTKEKQSGRESSTLRDILEESVEKQGGGGSRLNKNSESYLDDIFGARFEELKRAGVLGALWKSVENRTPAVAKEILSCFNKMTSHLRGAVAGEGSDVVLVRETLRFCRIVDKYDDGKTAMQVAEWLNRADKRGREEADFFEILFCNKEVTDKLNSMGDGGGAAAFIIGKNAEEIELHKKGLTVHAKINEVVKGLR